MYSVYIISKCKGKKYIVFGLQDSISKSKRQDIPYYIPYAKQDIQVRCQVT